MSELCFMYPRKKGGRTDDWQNVDTTGAGWWVQGHLLYHPLYLCLLENFNNTRFGFLFCFVFFTKTGKSKMQEAESDPALFLLEIFPTVIHGLHAGTLTIIQNACWESGCKRRENAWFHAK